ncbi:MAG: RNA polymerase sigma factor [Austwickia sp.]|nr:RNA polymerase sigma factor [Austwickia sp.]
MSTRAPGTLEQATFRALYADAYPDVLRFLRRRVHPDQAEDVAAETFLAAWRRIDDLPAEPDDARAWLFGIARNCLLNARRGEQRRGALAVRLAEAATGSPASTAPDPAVVAQRLDVAGAWSRLSDREQELIALSVLDGLTSAQAGAVLGVSAVAYRLRLSRARAHLRRALGEHAADPAWRGKHALAVPASEPTTQRS